MSMVAKSSGKSLMRNRIREFAAANPLVNEKGVADALALFSEIEKARKDTSPRVRFRIGRPYSTTVTGPEADHCESAPLLRFSLD
jgi:hypothetical protein